MLGWGEFQSWGAELLKTLLHMVLRRAEATVRCGEDEELTGRDSALMCRRTDCGWPLKSVQKDFEVDAEIDCEPVKQLKDEIFFFMFSIVTCLRLFLLQGKSSRL